MNKLVEPDSDNPSSTSRMRILFTSRATDSYSRTLVHGFGLLQRILTQSLLEAHLVISDN